MTTGAGLIELVGLEVELMLQLTLCLLTLLKLRALTRKSSTLLLDGTTLSTDGSGLDDKVVNCLSLCTERVAVRVVHCLSWRAGAESGSS